ncbi:polyprotein, partial [Ornithogalum virus 2]
NSGQPSTVVDNTLMVLLAMFYALHKSGISYQTYKQYCQFFINGDDLLIAVNGTLGESALDTFERSFSELGLNYKFDNRTREKTELWFMSHRGLVIDEMYIPKLEPERVVSILEWDRSVEPEHRLEAICAAMIESWGYPELTHQIRLFYRWVLTQAPYAALASVGKAPYISELALRNLYTGTQVKDSELEVYIEAMKEESLQEEDYNVYHQTSASSDLDAGRDTPMITTKKKDKDLDTGTSGTFSVPRLRQLPSKMSLPKVRGKTIVNLPHLITYTPDQIHLSNTRSTMKQFEFWYEGVKKEYEVDDTQMEIIMNGLMVWCIENGTSPNLNGMWVMMEGDEQIEFPLKPVIEFAQPTFRQIMAHFSNVAEAYIEKRNSEQKYMPRYGLQRNLTDYSLARYAFDFYEMTSKTPVRAREAHMQMKAAAIRGTTNRLFGLDGNVSQKEEDTERHTTEDVNRKMHSLLGVSTM